MKRDTDNFFKEAFREIPTGFKVLWAVGAVLSLAVTAVAVWAVIALVLHFT